MKHWTSQSMPAKNSCAKDRGLTLVEVLIALAITSMTVGMFAYFIDAMRMNRASAQDTSAAIFARDYLESLRGKWQSFEDYKQLALAMPTTELPSNYKLEIKIKNEKGEAIFSYPGGAAGEDDSLLRSIEVRLIDKQDVALLLQTSIARPTPVYIPEESENE